MTLFLIALLLRYLLIPHDEGVPFITFYAAVILSFYVGGIGPGILTSIISAFAAEFFFFPPYNQFVFEYVEIISTALYWATCVLIGWVVCTLQDVSAQLRIEQARIEHFAVHDALTGLPNRLLLIDRLRQALANAARDGRPVAICYLDLDGFKPINDRFGHETGDKLLVQISLRMSKAIRSNDTVCRLGGDEFVLVLPELDFAEEYLTILKRVIEDINEPVELDATHSVTVGVSVGVSIYPTHALTLETLIHQADQAMYQAKHSGRNRICIFQEDLPGNNHDR